MNIPATTLPARNALLPGMSAALCTVAAHPQSSDKGNPDHG
ncbi:hypothetical protein [Herbaspirillum rubrisubalbicans]|jgi:hypothetical protein|nr:hypothetical protein [Herbaspirillum rubrisubalbicans]MCP1573540.1 hypothetical protein [Herbaspirillum rubrisubalbicans]